MTNFSSISSLSGEYDLIIIGGGTAGLTIASRLSESPQFSLLVLEAGADRSDDPFVLTPGLVGRLYDNETYDWQFKTVPQKELRGRRVFHPRGKLLGGSSAIYQNKITYNSPGGWDAWSALGNPSWNWKSMQPYVRKFHTFHPPSATTKSEILDYSNVDEVLDGDDGPIQTGFSDEGSWTDVDIDFYKAFKTIKAELGWNETMGGSASPNSIDPKTKTRSFSVTGYLGPEVRKRENLKVVTEALVQRIILDKNGSNVIASGVQFSVPSGEEITIKAKKEVILCAGAFHSPAILELSGIGNPKILEKYSINVIIDNPNVGENLQDHAMVAISFEAADGVQTADAMFRDPSIFPALLEMYQKDRSGPLGVFCTVSSYTPSSLFDSSASDELAAILSASPKDPKNEDFEKELINLFKSRDGAACHNFLGKIQFHVASAETISQIRGNDALSKEKNFITLFASQNHPFSKGNVHIISSSVKDKPAVDPKYLSHPLDMEMMARNVQFLHKLTTTPPFSESFKPNGNVIPPNSFNRSSTPTLESAKETARDSLMSHFHPVGSCAMLPREKGGVVDESLKVYGVKGLRVCDASIFPMATRGNPISAVYAVAERGADLIKDDWK